MNIVVGPSGALTDAGFNRHLRPEPGCVLDLARAKFVDPFALVVLAAVTEEARGKGLDVTFRTPVDVDCAHYLHRMGLADVLDGYSVPHQLPPVRRRAAGDRLFELRRFGPGSESADLMAEQVYRIFSDEPQTARELYNSVSEVANNVLEHSGREGGFVALQQFPRTAEVSFAVADCGQGLRATLQKVAEVPDDGQAIRLAVRRHVTSTGVAGRGVGLYGLMRRTQRGGRLQLWSGRESGVFRAGRILPRISHHVVAFPGTVVQARIARE